MSTLSQFFGGGGGIPVGGVTRFPLTSPDRMVLEGGETFLRNGLFETDPAEYDTTNGAFPVSITTQEDPVQVFDQIILHMMQFQSGPGLIGSFGDDNGTFQTQYADTMIINNDRLFQLTLHDFYVVDKTDGYIEPVFKNPDLVESRNLGYIRCIGGDDNNLVAVIMENSFYISTDNGLTFNLKDTPTPSNRNVQFIRFNSVGDIFIIDNVENTYTSQDGGDTWNTVTYTGPGFVYNVRVINDSFYVMGSGTSIFAVNGDATTFNVSEVYTSGVTGIWDYYVTPAGNIFQSTNNLLAYFDGTSWTQIGDATVNNGGRITPFPNDPENIVSWDNDAGEVTYYFTKRNSANDLVTVDFSINNYTINSAYVEILTYNEFIYSNADGSSSLVIPNVGRFERSGTFSLVFSDYKRSNNYSTVWVDYDLNGRSLCLLESTDDFLTYKPYVSTQNGLGNDDGFTLDVFRTTTPDVVLVTRLDDNNDKYLYKSTDGGASFSPTALLSRSTNPDWNRIIDIRYCANTNTFFALVTSSITENTAILYSTDEANTWNENIITSQFTNIGTISPRVLTSNDDGIFIIIQDDDSAGANYNLTMYTEDGINLDVRKYNQGASTSSFIDASVNDIVVIEYITSLGRRVTVSLDGGKTYALTYAPSSETNAGFYINDKFMYLPVIDDNNTFNDGFDVISYDKDLNTAEFLYTQRISNINSIAFFYNSCVYTPERIIDASNTDSINKLTSVAGMNESAGEFNAGNSSEYIRIK